MRGIRIDPNGTQELLPDTSHLDAKAPVGYAFSDIGIMLDPAMSLYARGIEVLTRRKVIEAGFHPLGDFRNMIRKIAFDDALPFPERARRLDFIVQLHPQNWPMQMRIFELQGIHGAHSRHAAGGCV